MPNRVIKESIRTSPNFNELDDSAEVLFYRLLTLADDHGCFEASPDILRGQLFPKKLKSWAIKKIINSLVLIANNDLIRLWTKSDGTERGGTRLYGIFVTFSEHQRVRSVHSRKTPIPPNRTNPMSVNEYLLTFAVTCRQLTASRRQVPSNDRLNPNHNLNHNLNPKKIDKRLKPKQSIVEDTGTDQKKAVEVLKLAFLKKFKSNPYPYFDNDDHREKTFIDLNNTLANLVHRVKGNIDVFLSDMDGVAENGAKNVGTMLYFIKSQHGASRWDKMADEFHFQEHAQLKQEWIDALNENHRAKQLVTNLTARGQPEHVGKAIAEFKKLYKKWQVEENDTEKFLIQKQLETMQKRFGL